MTLGAYKHRVLSTHPLSAAALERLSFFFDVKVAQPPAGNPCTAVQLLQDMAGVITSADTISFAKDTVSQLPHLRAICLTSSQPNAIDLNVLTEAGIRATGLPDQPADHAQDTMWRILATEAQNQTRHPTGAALGNRPLRRFSGSLFTSSLYAMRLGFLGNSAQAHALLARALKAQAHGIIVGPSTPATADAAQAPLDWLVIPADWHTSGQPTDPRLFEALSNHTRILDFSAQPAPSTVLADSPQWAGRIIQRPIPVEHPPEPADPSATLAEQLIAALGFGRKSWHPDNLLNPDVCCESCC